MWKCSWVHADRTTPSKHSASYHGGGVQTVKQSQPGRRQFSLHSFWAAYSHLQGEWRSAWLQHSLSRRRKRRSLPEHRNHFRYSSGFCRPLRASWISPFKGGRFKGAWGPFHGALVPHWVAAGPDPFMAQSLALSQLSSQSNEAGGREGKAVLTATS